MDAMVGPYEAKQFPWDRSTKTRRSANRAAKLLRLAAVNVGKTQTVLGVFYRRLAARVGKAKAVTATARRLAVLFYPYNVTLVLRTNLPM